MLTKVRVKLGKYKDVQGNIIDEKRRDNGKVIFIVKLDKGEQETFAFHEVRYYVEDLQEAQ
jgi:hypothetical protein